MMTHDYWKVPDTARLPVSFGENVRGNIYYNPTTSTDFSRPSSRCSWIGVDRR